MNQEYTFTLKYKLPENIEDIDAIAGVLYQNGCDDALIGVGMLGYIALEFMREAVNAKEAIRSAHASILTALPTAKLVEALPDYVGLTDIAEQVGVSRQQMRKIYESANSFPAPLHSGKTAIWHLIDVLNWLKENKSYNINPLSHEIAEETAKLNSAAQTSKRINYAFSFFSKATEITWQTIKISFDMPLKNSTDNTTAEAA